MIFSWDALNYAPSIITVNIHGWGGRQSQQLQQNKGISLISLLLFFLITIFTFLICLYLYISWFQSQSRYYKLRNLMIKNGDFKIYETDNEFINSIIPVLIVNKKPLTLGWTKKIESKTLKNYLNLQLKENHDETKQHVDINFNQLQIQESSQFLKKQSKFKFFIQNQNQSKSSTPITINSPSKRKRIFEIKDKTINNNNNNNDKHVSNTNINNNNNEKEYKLDKPVTINSNINPFNFKTISNINNNFNNSELNYSNNDKTHSNSKTIEISKSTSMTSSSTLLSPVETKSESKTTMVTSTSIGKVSNLKVLPKKPPKSLSLNTFSKVSSQSRSIV